MSSYETSFHQSSIQYTDHLIQIRTDKNLLNFLAQKGKGSVELSKHIRECYQGIFKKELQITEDSLAVEILIHVYLDLFLEGIEKAGKLLPADLKKQLLSVAENLKSHKVPCPACCSVHVQNQDRSDYR